MYEIGYSEQTAEKRISQQNDTADVTTKLEWTENAVYSGSDEVFSDHDFHAYLVRDGVERLKNDNGSKSEWFRIKPRDARISLMDFRDTHGVLEGSALPYDLRTEQQDAITKTCDYFEVT